MTRKLLPKLDESVHTDKLHNKNVLSLDKLRAEGKADAQRITEHEKTIKKRRKVSLILWFAQAKRCWIAAEEHRLKGASFVRFAVDIGVDRSTAYELVKLYPHCAELSERFEKEEAAHGPTYEWPTLTDVLIEAGIRAYRGGAAGQTRAKELIVEPLQQEVEEQRKRIEDLETELDDAHQTIRRKATDAPAHIWQHGSDEWASPQALWG